MADPRADADSLPTPDYEALDSQSRAELIDRYNRTLLTLHWHSLSKRSRKKLHRLDPLIYHTVRNLAEGYNPLSQRPPRQG